MARDPLETRQHVPTVPDDTLDPARFAQVLETTKDCMVLELRKFFRTQNFTTERRQELPTVVKYATGFGTGLDPYETFVQIVQEYPDILERLPHVAVTATAAANMRRTAGPPFIAHTQLPPRVVTANAGPYALTAVAEQINDISVSILPPGTYTITLSGLPFSYVAGVGETAAQVLGGLASALRNAVGALFEITLLPAEIGVPASTLRLRRYDLAQAVTVIVSANLISVLVQAASASGTPDKIVYRTKPDRINPIESQVIFTPDRFPTTNPISSALASDVVRVWNEQALYSEATAVPVGVGTGMRVTTGGIAGGNRTPNEIEVLAGSTANAVSVLGLGNFGNAAAGDTISGVAPNMTLNVVGAGFTVVMIGRFVTISGAPSSVNNGRFPVTAAPSGGALSYTNNDGVAEAAPAAAWFVGFRDDSRNVARPVQNRYHIAAQVTVNIDILAESPNERREVTDLVWAFYTFFLEQQFFTFYGRGVFDEAFPDEHYQISVHQEVSSSPESEFRRGEDQKVLGHVARISIPMTTTHFVDRQVLVPSGLDAGQSFVLLPGEVIPATNLIPKS